MCCELHHSVLASKDSPSKLLLQSHVKPQPVQPTSTTTQQPAKKKKKKISKQEKPASSPDPPTNAVNIAIINLV